MKKIMNKVNFALIALMVSVAPALAATSTTDKVCDLINELGGILKYIRLFAFVGAGFMIVQWAWDYIKGGDVAMDKIKGQGAALLVGCFLLFLVGTILTFLIAAAAPGGSLDCDFSSWSV